MQASTRETSSRGQGELRHIKKLPSWPLDQVLQDKYGLPRSEVRSAAAQTTSSLEASAVQSAAGLLCTAKGSRAGAH